MRAQIIQEWVQENQMADARGRLERAEDAMCGLINALQEAADAYRLLDLAGEYTGRQTHARLMAGIEDVHMTIEMAQMWLDQGKLSAGDVLEVRP